MNFRNIVRLKVVANGLAELPQKVVFIGGAVVELYCDDPARSEARPTDDVDVVVEVLSRGAFAELEEKLRQIGFQPDSESSIICRHRYHDIIVDIMPADGAILGFTNAWYREGIKNTTLVNIADTTLIEVFEVPYFLASKLEALKSERHGKDYRLNSDFEDIVYLFDNRTTLITDLLQSDHEVKGYLKKEIEQLLNRPYIREEIAANLEFSNQYRRLEKIIDIWRELIS
jgi:hypothetical protein